MIFLNFVKIPFKLKIKTFKVLDSQSMSVICVCTKVINSLFLASFLTLKLQNCWAMYTKQWLLYTRSLLYHNGEISLVPNEFYKKNFSLSHIPSNNLKQTLKAYHSTDQVTSLYAMLTKHCLQGCYIHFRIQTDMLNYFKKMLQKNVKLFQKNVTLHYLTLFPALQLSFETNIVLVVVHLKPIGKEKRKDENIQQWIVRSYYTKIWL